MSSFIVFSLRYVQMEESSAQVSTAVGWTVPGVCTAPGAAIIIFIFRGFIDIFSFTLCPNYLFFQCLRKGKVLDEVTFALR